MILPAMQRRIIRIGTFPKGLWNAVLATGSYVLRSPAIWGKPVNATIEPTNLCNQQCPACETGMGALKRPRGTMPFKHYTTIIDKIAPHTNTLLLYYMGEPFLHKDIYLMIAYAKARRIFVKICTNGLLVDSAKLFDSGLDEIQFQLGGVSQKTHEIYRKGGQLSKVLDAVRATVRERDARRRNGKKIVSRIYLGLIVMRHNEQEIPAFLQLANEIGVDDYRLEAPCVRSIAQARDLIPRDWRFQLYDKHGLENGVLRHRNFRAHQCRWMNYSLTITWEGDVIPCCRDVQARYVMGNLIREDMRSLWNGEKFKAFRRDILKGAQPLAMCQVCDGLTFPSLENV